MQARHTRMAISPRLATRTLLIPGTWEVDAGAAFFSAFAAETTAVRRAAGLPISPALRTRAWLRETARKEAAAEACGLRGRAGGGRRVSGGTGGGGS